MTFWEHLDELRNCILKVLLAMAVGGIVAFCLKDWLFNVVLAPCHGNFPTYRLLGAESLELHLINTGLAEQMLVHMKMALAAGILVASPYIVYVLFSFVSPALYEKERRHSFTVTLVAYAMFMVGAVVNYFLIFPLTVHFLGTYQVSPDIDNMLTVSSYTDTLLMMTMVFGIVFEIPVVSWLLAVLGLLRAEWMQRYRRHAVVAVLVVAAIITPTADMFTLIVVSLPMWLLYEISIIVVKYAQKN